MNIYFKNDFLGRKSFIEKATKLITHLPNAYNSSYVLSINGIFGTGKTTLLSLWNDYLLEQKDRPEANCNISNIITINAWKSDFTDNPIIPIIHSIKEVIEKDKDFLKNHKSFKEKLLIAMGATSTQMLTRVLSLASDHSGIDIKEILQNVSSQTISAIGSNISENYTAINDAYESIQKTLKEYINQKGNLIIFVDELDRARPDYAVQFLEVIKHLFDIKGICFIIAINKEQLERSVKQLYGNLDFNNYYARFITNELELTKPDEDNICQYIKELQNRYNWNALFPNNVLYSASDRMEELCHVFTMTPRHIEYFFRTVALYASISPEKTQNLFYTDILIIMIAIKVVNPNLYRKLGTHSCNNEDFKYIINTLERKNLRSNKLIKSKSQYNTDGNFIAMLLYLAFFPGVRNKADYRNKLTELNLNLTNLPDKMETYYKSIHYQDYYTDIHCNTIYHDIETWHTTQ